MVRIHRDGIKITRELAIRQAKTAPKTGLAASGNQRGSSARTETLVTGAISSNIGSTGASQSRDLSFLFPSVDTQIRGDPQMVRDCADGALRRKHLTRNECFREGTASRVPTSAAIGMRQHSLDLTDPRILFEV